MGARTPVFVKTLRQEGTWALKDGELAHQVLDGEGKGSGPEALGNLQSALSCQHSQPKQTAPLSRTASLLPDRRLTEDGGGATSFRLGPPTEPRSHQNEGFPWEHRPQASAFVLSSEKGVC